MSRQDEILNEIARIHQEWYDEVEADVKLDFSHSNPHDKETGDSDYMVHYPDVSATPEQEKLFQDRIAPLLQELKEL